jgi:hypothetical protein
MKSSCDPISWSNIARRRAAFLSLYAMPLSEATISPQMVLTSNSKVWLKLL